MAKLAQYLQDLPKPNEYTPDFISQQIHDFMRPKLKTPDEWADFYLDKMTPLRYTVGMQFYVQGNVTTITHVCDNLIITLTGHIETIISKHFGAFFKYKGFEACYGLQWFDLIGDINYFDKRYLLTNLLSHKYMIDLLKSERAIYACYIHPVDDSSFTEDFEAMGYAAWGARITATI